MKTKQIIIATTIALTVSSPSFAVGDKFSPDTTSLENQPKNTVSKVVSDVLSNQQPIKGVEQQRRFIVMYRNDQASEQLLESTRDIVRTAGGQIITSLQSVNAVVAMLTPAQKQTIEALSQVHTIEPDPVRHIQAESANWGMAAVGADGDYPDLTANRKVCVIDTGYDRTHEDLMKGANVTGVVSNTLSTDVDLGEWYQDSYGHGTQVTGVIAALGNNMGVRGIAWDNQLQLHNVKVIHNPNYWQIWGSDLIAAVDECQTAGANIINISIAGSKSSAAEEQAFQQAWDAGLLIVGAAGNRGNSSLYYPASYDSVISVGATDDANNRWRYSQTNDQIELTAPGANIRSTSPDNQYRSWDGTSMAAPFVSGIAAQVWSRNTACSNQDIRNVLQQSAQDLGSVGRDNEYGFGLVQLASAIQQIEAMSCGEPPVQGTDEADNLENYDNGAVIMAGAGDDVITGNGSLYGEAGHDTFKVVGGPTNLLDGGDDFDVAIFPFYRDQATINYLDDGSVQIIDNRANSSGDVTILKQVEAIEFLDDRLATTAPQLLRPVDQVIQIRTGGSIDLPFVKEIVKHPEYPSLTYRNDTWRMFVPATVFGATDYITYIDNNDIERYARIEIQQHGANGRIRIGEGYQPEIMEMQDNGAEGSFVVSWHGASGLTEMKRFVSFASRSRYHYMQPRSAYDNTPQLDVTSDNRIVVSGGKFNAVGLSFFDEELTPGVQKTVYGKPSQRAGFALLPNNQVAWTYIEGRNDDDAFTLQIDSIDGDKSQTFPLGQVSQGGKDSKLLTLRDGSFLVTSIIDGAVETKRFSHTAEQIGDTVTHTSPDADVYYNFYSVEHLASAQLRNDNYIVAWSQTERDSESPRVVTARIMQPDGTPVTNPFPVHSAYVEDAKISDIAATPDGRFIVAFSTTRNGLSDSYYRVFDANGQALTAPVQIEEPTPGRGVSHPHIGVLSHGQVLLTFVNNERQVYMQSVVLPTPLENIYSTMGLGHTVHAGPDENVYLSGEGHIVYGGNEVLVTDGDDIVHNAKKVYTGDGNDIVYGGKDIITSPDFGSMHYDLDNDYDRIYVDGAPEGGITTIDSGYNFDDLILTGNRRDYQIEHDGDGSYTITGIGAAANDGIIKTKNLEAVEFADDRILLPFYQNEPETAHSHLVQTEFSTPVGVPFVHSPDQLPSFGSLSFENNQWQYNPNIGVGGVDRFTYLDENGESQQVSVEVGLPGNNFTKFINYAELISIETGKNGYVYVLKSVNKKLYLARYSFQGTSRREQQLYTDGSDITHLNLQLQNNGELLVTYTTLGTIYVENYNPDLTPVLSKMTTIGGLSVDVRTDHLAGSHTVVGTKLVNHPGGIYIETFDKHRRRILDFFTDLAVSNEELPGITALPDGSFVVAGIRDNQLIAKRYSPTGRLISQSGNLAHEAIKQLEDVSDIHLTGLAGGDYAISWQQTDSKDVSKSNVYTRMIGANSESRSDLETVTMNSRTKLTLEDALSFKDGGWAVFWRNQVDGFPGKMQVNAHLFDANGQSISREHQLYSATDTTAQRIRATLLNDRRLLAAIVSDNKKLSFSWPTRATAQDDVLRANAGDELIYGHGGNDTVIYPGISADYHMRVLDGKTTIEDISDNGSGGLDWLFKLTNIVFSDD